MMLDVHSRRLGDMLSGSVVVREGKDRFSRDLLLRLPFRESPFHPEEVLARISLTPAEYQALRTFCFRTRSVRRKKRLALGRQLLAPLHIRAGIPMPAGLQQEQLLVDLLHRENGTFGKLVAGVVPEKTSRS